MKSGKSYKRNLLLAAIIVSLSVTMPMNVAYADNPTPTRGANAAYTITNGTVDNHNFTTSDGSTTSYYKTNLSVFNLLNNINDSTVWLEGTQGNKNFSVVLPNNETRYFIYGYTKPDGWGDGERQVYDYNGNAAGNSAFYNNRTFNGLNSTVSGGAIYIQGNYQAEAGHGSNLVGTMTADFINNSITNTDTSEKGLGGALHIWGKHAGIETLNANFINNHITYGTTNSGGGALAIGEGTNGGESTVGLINGNFINNYIEADYNNFGGAIYYNGSGNGDGEITSIGQDPLHTTKFVGNHILGSGQGGAIYAVNKIGSIYADFIGNYIAGKSDNSRGGAISLTKTSDEKNVGSITGDFIGNYITTSANNGSAWGGAIYNNNIVGSITGDFIGNYIESTYNDTYSGGKSVYGGAIYNTGTIGTNITGLTGNFIGNYANGQDVYGGAIYNIGTITTLNGKFIENDAYSNVQYGYNAVGGAIANKENGVIQSISGDFIRNKAHTSYTSNSSMMATGGAIYNDGAKIGTINANFIENEAQREAGAIYNNGNSSNNNGIGTISGNFIKNKVTGEIAKDAKGGAISNTGTINSITAANFTNNTVDSTNGYGSYGGAIYNSGTIGYYETTINEWTSEEETKLTGGGLLGSTFSGNSASTSGGAIYNNSSAVINIISADFENNSANAKGGAVFNEGTIGIDNGYGYITDGGFIDSSFRNNSATESGGAIYNNSSDKPVLITAKTKDITFSGNKAANGASIYNTSSGGTSITADGGNVTFTNNTPTDESGYGIYSAATVNLVAKDGYSIKIDDSINISNPYADITVNQGYGYTGTVELNGKIKFNNSNQGIRVGMAGDESGTLKLGQTPANDTYNYLQTAGNFTLDLQNEHAGDNLVLKQLSGTATMKLNVDYDATANSMDKITVNGGSGTITLNAVNVMNDNVSFVDGTEATYLDGAARNNITVISDAIQSTIAGTTVYTFTPDSTTHGLLTVSRNDAPYTGDLIDAIQDTQIVHPTAYSMQDNFTANRNFGALSTVNREQFTIFGNNHTISGDNNTYTGIEVASGQTLNLDNVRFSNVKDYDVQNAGTLNLSGTNTINIITGTTGTTNINSGATTFTNSIAQNEIAMKGGRIVVNSGATITGDVKGYEDIPYISENGTRAIYNNGGIISKITGTFKGNSAAQSTTSNVKGGVLYTQNGTVAIDSATFDGNSVEGSSGGSGGAIYSNGTALTITGTAENPTVFKNNGISKYENSTGSASGGAIYQKNGTLNISNTKFENNVSSFNTKQYLYGGAIYSEATGGNISADFTGNTLSAAAVQGAGNGGGAIYNEGTLTKITGDFTSNAITLQPTSSSEQYGESSGGAIANGGTITNGIDGTFSGNTITTNVKQSDANGGALANTGTIGNITGDFLNNSVASTNTTYSGSARGGAIYNLNGTIGNIIATSAEENGFKGNSATKAAGYNAEGLGGAIYNHAEGYNATIGNITADFINNTATTNGGAIYNYAADNNKAEIGNIIGNFTGNTAYQGSAIYNYVNNDESYIDNKLAIIGDITGNFSENNGTVIYNKGYYDFNNFNEIVYAQIGDITGNFAENSASSGNVIFNNYGKIGDITGDFTENTTNNGVINNMGSIDSITANTTTHKGFYKNTGGAIRNYASESYHREATIGNITADFKENVAQANGGGAAINNSSENANLKAKIGDITGDFDKNTSKNYGGAIYNNYSIIGAQNNLGEFTGTAITGDFTYNQVDNNSVYNSIGGAIANVNSSAIGNIQGNFENNSIIDSRYKAMGGAIANRTSSTIGNITGNFNANSISYNPIFDTDTFVAQHYGDSSLGGAIYNDSTSTIGTLTGDFVGNRAKGHVAEDDTTTVFAAAGGAIFNEGTLGTITGDIKNNYALGHSHHGVYGGAIYTTTGLNLVDSDITGNYVTTQSTSATDLKGGAIYTTDGINITASTKDISVSGNYGTEQGAAIYNTSENNAVVLNATGGNITFENNNLTGLANGSGVGIYSAGGLTLNAADGKYIAINDALNITGNTTLNGKLKLGDNAVETLANTTSKFIATGGTLDIANGAIDTMNFTNAVDIQNAINLGLDVNLTGTTATADKITADITSGNTSAITLSALNFINDNYTGSEEDHELIIADGTIKSLINENITSTTGNTNSYSYSYDQNTGVLTVSLVTYNNIYDAVHDTEKATRTYKIKLDDGETITQALGALAGTKLTVNGNNKYLDGDSKGGITVANGQTLELKNISQLRNFTTAVDNAGTLNVEGVTFTGNTTDINNTATLNLSGNNTIKTITGATGNTNINGGATWIKGGSVTQNTINLKGGDLVLDLSTSLPLTPGTITANIVGDGTVEKTGIILNSGTINGTISGTFKGNNNTALANYGTVGNITADFVNNTATVLSSNAKGGAIYNEGGTLGTISGNFTGNSATNSSGNAYGGAIYYNGTNTNSITNSTFTGNSATATATNKYGYGGAIYQTGGTLSAANTKFINNSATGKLYGYGGAIYLKNGSSPYSITGTKTGTGTSATSTTEFIGNQASEGGAIDIFNTSGKIDGVVFNGNGKTTTDFGSAVLYHGGTQEIDNSVFIANNSNSTSNAVVEMNNTGSLTVDNAEFINNASMYAVHSYRADMTIKNSEFSGNGLSSNEQSSVISASPYNNTTNIYDTNIKNNNANAIGFSDANGTTNTLNIIANEVGGGVEISGNSGYGILVQDRFSGTTDSSILLYAKNGDILIENNAKGAIGSLYDSLGINTPLPTLTLNADANHNITINDSISYKRKGLNINSNNNGGTVALNGALTLGGDTNIQGGTLKLGTAAAGSTFKTVAFANTPTLDLQNSSAQTTTVTSISGNANLNIDIDFTGDSVISDAINITTGGQTGVITLDSIAALSSDSDIKEFSNLAILTGETSGVTLAISTALQHDTRFNGAAVETLTWESDYSDNATFAQNVFTNTEYSETKQKQLSIVDGTKLSFAESTTIPKHATGNITTQDVLQALNQHANTNRFLTTDDATATYTVGADLGATGTGVMTVRGTTSGANKSTLNMNNKTGFDLSGADENTMLGLGQLNIININDTADGGLINNTGNAYDVTLANVTLEDTTHYAILNNKNLTLAGTNDLGKGINGTGNTSISLGTTTADSIIQKSISIASTGGLEVATVTTTDGISNDGTLTLTGTANANTISGTGHTTIAGNVNNTGAINQAITVNGTKTLTTAANLIGGTVTNGGTVELTGGALGQTITGGDITIASGEVTSTVANLGGDITNDATLNLSGTLNKNIAGTTGVTKLNDNMTFADGAGVAGTLNFSGKAITMSGDNKTSTFNIGKINSDGTINIDVNTSGTPVYDAINLTAAGSTGTIIINSINEIGSRGDDFTLNILQGTTGGLQLALSEAVHSQFDQAQQHNIYYVSDAYQANIDFDKTSFNTAEWDRVTQKAISVEDNTKIKYSTNVISDTPTGNVTQKDALAFINQNTDTSAVAVRRMVTSDTNKTYTVQEDLGTTGAGTLLVQGASDKTAKLNMNNHSGFVVANSETTVTLKDINVNNVQNSDGALVNITNTGSSATLDGVTVASNSANVISSNGSVTVKDSTVNAGINNTGTLNFEGTSKADKVLGSTGTTNVKGQTTLGSLVQKLVNIVTGGKLIANGDVTTGTSTGEGVNNAVANGLELNNGTLTGNVTGSGSTDFKGTSAIADGSTVGQAITVVDGKLTTLADGLGGAVTNGGEVDLTGGTLKTSITGGNTTISGTNVSVDDTNGLIASAVKVETDGKLTTNASNVTGAINNGGNLDLTGGDIKNTISGNGNTTISGTVTNTTGSAIGNAVTVATTGDLTTAADKLGGAVQNGGTVQLNGGTLGQTITGGNISIIDNVDTNASNLAGATTVASSKELTLTGGDVNSNISGAGDTKITGTVNNNANISTATEVAGGALDNTNGQLADVTVTSGSLKSNADNVGAVANNGTYEITGGTIANAISGTGAINITGDVINNATNTTTGAVTVGAGNELKIGATGDVFRTASSVTMGDNSTLNLQNGSAVATNINNVVVGADDTLNLALDWGDQVNTTNPSNIAGNLQISSVDLTGTDGSKQTYQITTTDGIKDKISIKDPLDIQGTGVSNFVKYNDRPASANYGQLTTYQNSLFMAVTDTEVGEIATYNMITDETAGGGELDGALKVQGNGHSITTGGVVIGSTTIQNAELTLEDANLQNITGDAIQVYGGNKGHIVANAHDVAITANTGNAIKLIANGTNYAEMDIDAGSKTVTIDNDIVSDDSHNKVTFKGGNVQFNGKFDPAMGVVDGSTVTRGGQDDGIDWTLTNGTLYYTNDTYLNKNTNSVIFNGGNLDTRNGVVTTFNLANMTLNAGTSNFYADVDLANQTMDNFGSTPVVDNGGKLNVAGLNLISDAANVNTTINFTTDPVLMAAVNYTGSQGLTALSPIYKYNVGYDNTTGNFDFARYNTGGYGDYNPSILAAPVAAQMGGYLTQLNSYDEAFRNMDMYMLMTAQQRQALKNKNKIASLDGGVLYDATLMRQERAEGWFRPFATFEKVGLRNGPKVENIAYGTYMGGESQMYDLGHGWDGIWGAYVGYNGSHQNYDGVSIYQNGGTLGALGMAYKGNFFTGLTINAGASGVEASTMYGNEDFAMLMAGIASKTGYNWELFNGKFIIQPSMLMSYSFVNTFDYKNAAGVNVDSDPLHAIQLQPEIKFIGNLKNGWQPYASVAMVWNIMDNTKFKANDVSLPELSVKPYVKYGVGVRKTWGERLTGFFQTYFTNGGRNGVGLQVGFTWAFGGGKDKKADEKKIQKSLNKTPELKKTEIVLNGKKVQ